MTTTGTGLSYTRTAEVVWRSVGDHVLVRAIHRQPAETLVLGGGNAQLWHLLDRRQDLPSLMAVLGSWADAPPEREVQAALEDLVGAGLVSVAQTEL